MEIRIAQAEVARCQPDLPVIWFEAGLGGTADQWPAVLDQIQGTLMTVRTTRTNPENPQTFPDHWRTMMLGLAGCARKIIPPGPRGRKRPVILVGHSYGSLLIRAWANWVENHPAPNYQIVSLLSIDPSVEGNPEGNLPLLRPMEQQLSRFLSPRYAQELPHFYQAWQDLQDYDLTYSAVHHVLSARRKPSHWQQFFQRQLLYNSGQQWLSDSRFHHLPKTDPATIAQLLAWIIQQHI